MINLKLINAIARMAIVVCCCWLSNTSLWAQFEGAYYSNLSKNHQSVVESVSTPGNTVVAETIGGNTATTLDIHLLELDGAGNVVNERTYDSGANEEAFHIAPSIAGGYVVCGYQSNAGRDRGLILEFDANFNLVNQARYHNTSTKHSTAFHIIPTAADPVPGYVVVGTLASDFTYTGAKTSYVLKLDGALNKLWERHLNSAAPAGPQDWDMAVHVLEIPGQGYFVGGSATATPGNNSTFCDQTVMAARISYANVVVWKKSMDDNGPATSGHLSIGADAFYDASTNEIYQLANFSINHHFGIVVYDFATGAINPAKSFKVFSNLGYINLDGMRILPDPSGNTYVVAGYLRDGNYTAPDGTFVSGTFPFACEIDKVSQTTIWDELYPVPAAGFAGTSTAPYDLFFTGQQPLNLHPKMALRYNSGNGYSLTGPRTAPIVPFETELLQLDLMGLNPCLSTPIALNPIVLQPTDYALGFTSAVLTRQNPALTLVPVGTTPDLCSTNDPCTVDAAFSINPLGDCCYEFQDLTPDASAAGANCDNWEIFDAFGGIVATGTGDSFVFCFPSSGSFLICNNDCCINGDGSLTTSKICQPLEVQCCNIQPAIVSSNEGCIYSFYVINTTSTPLDQICYTWLDGTTHTGTDTITVDLSGYCGIYGGCVPIFCCNDPSNVTTFCFDQYVCCQPCEPDPNFNVLYLDPCCISVEPNNPTPCLLSPLGVATTDVNGDGVIDAADTAIILNSGCCSVDWGDGTTSLPGVHCYTISGVYTVCYTACCIGTDGVLYSATSCQQVTVQCGQPCDPNPLFEYTVDACCVSIFPVATAPCIISPLGTATIDINNDGVIDNTDLQILLAANCCTVDWGDGTLTNGVFNHCYATGGVYTICYTACCVGTDGQLYSATHCETITINCCAPVDFTWAILYNANCEIGACIAPGPDPSQYCALWSWGDGTSEWYPVDICPTHTYACPGGVFDVCVTLYCCDVDNLTPTSATGITYCQTVTVNCCTLPSAAFITADITDCTVNFGIGSTDDYCGDICVEWDFGDGTFASGTWTANHTYSASGWYHVCATLHCCNNDVETLVVCTDIYVNCGCCYPTDFTSTTDGCAVCVFPMFPADCISTSLVFFDYGDGTGLTTDLCHTYTGSGTYLVCMYAECPGIPPVGILCHEVSVNCGGCCPNADFSWTNTVNCYEVQFAGPNCDINGTVFWSFGDGGTAVGYNPVHTYAGPGWYHVCMHICCVNADGTVTNTDICHDVYVPECGCNPDADFWWEYSGDCCVTFHDLTPDGNIYGCESWVFGLIQSVLAGDDVTFCFPGTGWYTVCHYDCCLDAAGNSWVEEICHDIWIDCGGCCLPDDFTWTCTDNCCFSFNPLQFTDCVPGANTYQWDFGDGTTSTDQYPVHCYQQNGNYLVCLTVICPNGLAVNYCHYLQVSCVPCINPAQIDPNMACIDLYDPVCGCDGVTYSNSCYAYYYGGVTSWVAGPCNTPCFDAALVNPNPTCPDIYAPVCGCDGVTYSNSCYAQAAGNTSWTDGPCTSGGCCLPQLIGIEPVADCCFQLQPIYLVDCVSNNTYQWVIDGTVVSNDASYLHCFPAAGAHSICLNVYCPDGNLGISFCETVDCGGGSGCCQPSDFTYVCDGCCFTFSPLYLVDCVSFNAYFWQFGDGAVSTEENPTHCYATSGVYQVCLTATCPDGSVYTFCQWVTANCPAMCCPPSGIFANQNTDCCWEFGPEYFLTDCDPAGNQYYWQFGDGNVSYDAYPVHCYAADGIYDVCLTVICPDGQTYTLCETITTDCQPCDVALFPQVVQNGCIWTVTFVNNGTTPLNEICVIVEGGVVITADQYIQVLDFSNNCNSGWGICYQYWCCNDPNSIPVGLCVDYIVNCCCDDVPADFTWVNTSDCCTQFFGPGSEPFTGIPCISWDFGDGTTSNELNPVHCWNGPGVYHVCMTTCCLDADGNVIASSTVCHEVLVECCTLPFEWFANADGCQVCYSPIYEGPNPTSCVLWNFGDGTWGWGVNPCHTYNASGVYDVCMYAWCCDDVDVVVDPTNVDGVIDLIADLDAQGLLATICHPVTVQCDCTVPCDVHASFNQELSNSTVQFTNTSSSGPGTTIVSYFWDFGDGNTSNLEHPLHTYAQTGTYLVCLTVTAVGEDGSTCTDTFCFPVTIPCVGDLDGNGVVNILDVLMVLGAYGMQCP